MRAVWLALPMALPVASCGSNSSSVKSCTDLYASGAVAPDTDKVFQCRNAKGESQLMPFATFPCKDGSELNYNEFGWWLTVDRVVHAGEPPTAKCLGT